MGKIPDIPHLRAVRALERAGFHVVRESGHIVMANDAGKIVTIPRHNPVNAITMFSIAKDAGLSAEQFRRLL